MSQLYQDTLRQLRECYDTHAHKFASTRHKHWPEMDWIIDNLTQYQETLCVDNKKGLDILELGCGDGRLWTYCHDKHIRRDSYYGVDISEQLIAKAEERSQNDNKTTRVVNDMLSELKKLPSESKDVVICMASFQHLPDSETRNAVLRQIYRVLRYDGIFLSIDRSWSWWMLRKHIKAISQSFFRSISSLGRWERNNITIPFSNADHTVTSYRLYHIFTMKELALLLQIQGFALDTMIYSSQEGVFHHHWTKARNICTLARKRVFEG